MTIRRIIIAIPAVCMAALIPFHDRAQASGRCFLQEQAARTTVEGVASTVEIVTRTEAGITTGSGFVMADSDGGEGPSARRILTARHVVSPGVHPARVIGVLDSDGTFLGTAEIVTETTRKKAEASDGSVMPGSDMAVLKMKSFNRTPAVYAAIPGVSLAPYQEGHIMSGLFRTPGGIEHGASGAPALDNQGNVVGVTIRAGNDLQGAVEVRRSVGVGRMVRDYEKGGFRQVQGSMSLPYRAMGYVEPVTDQAILDALGPAGRGISRMAHADDTETAVTIPSYPMENCVVYQGIVH